MPDLGLSALGDEQLVNLLEEAVMELITRDPVVQKVAQSGVLALAKKRELFHQVLQQELAACETNYLESIRLSVRGDVVQAIESGEINIGQMVGSTKEAQFIVEVTQKQIAEIKQSLIRSPEKSSFSIRFNGNTKVLDVSYHADGQNWDAKRNMELSPTIAESIRKAILGAFGIPTD